jgi:hypothetical protein
MVYSTIASAPEDVDEAIKESHVRTEKPNRHRS